MTFLCWNPIFAVNCFKSPELKFGPLSDWTIFGTPCVEKIFFIFFRTGLIEVEIINSTSGYLEYWSMMINETTR